MSVTVKLIDEISNNDYSSLDDIFSINYNDIAVKLMEKGNEYYLERIIDRVNIGEDFYVLLIRYGLEDVVDTNKVNLDYEEIVGKILLSYDRGAISRMCEGDLSSYIDYDFAIKAVKNNNSNLLSLILYTMEEYNDCLETVSYIRSNVMNIPESVMIILDEWNDDSVVEIEARMK